MPPSAGVRAGLAAHGPSSARAWRRAGGFRRGRAAANVNFNDIHSYKTNAPLQPTPRMTRRRGGGCIWGRGRYIAFPEIVQTSPGPTRNYNSPPPTCSSSRPRAPTCPARRPPTRAPPLHAGGHRAPFAAQQLRHVRPVNLGLRIFAALRRALLRTSATSDKRQATAASAPCQTDSPRSVAQNHRRATTVAQTPQRPPMPARLPP